MWALWVVANPSARHTHQMSGTTTATTSVTARFGPTLILAVPFLVALIPETIEVARTMLIVALRS